jgi:hypothetical protein
LTLTIELLDCFGQRERVLDHGYSYFAHPVRRPTEGVV